MRKLTVVTAGLSNPSTTRTVADQLTKAVQTAVSARGESLDIEVIEIRDLIFDLATSFTSAGMSSPALDAAKERLANSDGLIAVTPIFSASYSGIFKMFFDVLDPKTIVGLPTIIAASAGTARHSLVLDHAIRPLFTYLRAVVVPTGVFAATEDFGTEAGADFERRVNRAAGELATLMLQDYSSVEGLGGATANQDAGLSYRRTTGVAPGENFNSFADLLKGHDGNG
ncbi:FMN reductase [Corynebacterium crudilactis]|uniref:Flavoprotein n=1 Tax=Corynebacterium crudilactis TaxID=1652495 RepID=A0A172QTW3_9CORY|nr:FMN reductase [Corynebacterium crudilactis]ANE04147.1 flavoprotein [Corynebacterium crudilactis]